MENEKDIVYSQSIKAGKRIYYLDVKRNKRNELFLAITESKKVITGEGPDAPCTFEKHKVFLYQEDFTKFVAGLSKAIKYIHENQVEGYRFAALADNAAPAVEPVIDGDTLDELDIQIDFE